MKELGVLLFAEIGSSCQILDLVNIGIWYQRIELGDRLSKNPIH